MLKEGSKDFRSWFCEISIKKRNTLKLAFGLRLRETWHERHMTRDDLSVELLKEEMWKQEFTKRLVGISMTMMSQSLAFS